MIGLTGSPKQQLMPRSNVKHRAARAASCAIVFAMAVGVSEMVTEVVTEPPGFGGRRRTPVDADKAL